MIQQDAAPSQETDEQYHLQLIGPLDEAQASGLVTLLVQAIDAGNHQFLLDMKRVPYVDSNGLKMLLRVADLDGDELMLTFINANPVVASALELARINYQLPLTIMK